MIEYRQSPSRVDIGGCQSRRADRVAFFTIRIAVQEPLGVVNVKPCRPADVKRFVSDRRALFERRAGIGEQHPPLL
jgi:hypothetical protein